LIFDNASLSLLFCSRDTPPLFSLFAPYKNPPLVFDPFFISPFFPHEAFFYNCCPLELLVFVGLSKVLLLCLFFLITRPIDFSLPFARCRGNPRLSVCCRRDALVLVSIPPQALSPTELELLPMPHVRGFDVFSPGAGAPPPPPSAFTLFRAWPRRFASIGLFCVSHFSGNHFTRVGVPSLSQKRRLLPWDVRVVCPENVLTKVLSNGYIFLFT